MKVIAKIPSRTGHTPSYIVELDASEVEAFCAATYGAGLPVREDNRKEVLKKSVDLQAGDVVDSYKIQNYRTRIVNTNERRDDLKKAIASTRKALTRLEEISGEITEEAEV